MRNSDEAKSVRLTDDGQFPNSSLPLIVYPPELTGERAPGPEIFELRFRENGWGGSWRNGVYPYHHYHSTAHEVLGCFAGSAVIRLGGDSGIEADVTAGTVVVIPAGVAHKRLSSTTDFAVVGAYPSGTSPDMRYGKDGERPDADESIAGLALPEQDPWFGAEGPLLALWAP